VQVSAALLPIAPLELDGGDMEASARFSHHDSALPAPRLHGLDFLRATAIGWVMVYHASFYGFVPVADAWYVKFGWMGVDLFFVLSGFLIAGQLLRPFARGHQPDYRRFFLRRFLRTLPAYAAVIALYFLFPRLREQPDIDPIWRFATFTENLFLDLSAANPSPMCGRSAWKSNSTFSSRWRSR
jgi:peptidoglycan/LPS O-acetylase OafA/YrhL